MASYFAGILFPASVPFASTSISPRRPTDGYFVPSKQIPDNGPASPPQIRQHICKIKLCHAIKSGRNTKYPTYTQVFNLIHIVGTTKCHQVNPWALSWCFPGSPPIPSPFVCLVPFLKKACEGRFHALHSVPVRFRAGRGDPATERGGGHP